MINEEEDVVEHLGIIIDYSRDMLLPEKGLAMLTAKGFYKKDWEESPQESFARAATCYSFGDYEFAQRIYDYASNGWFTNASPVLSNAIEVDWPTFTEGQFEEAAEWLEENVIPDGMPISCFEAGTPVMTILGEKPIEDIIPGDYVLTHRGRFKPVEAIRTSQSSDLYEFQVVGQSTLMRVTGNHRILTNMGWIKVEDLVIGKHLIATNREIYFKTEESIEYDLSSFNKTRDIENSGQFKRNVIVEKVTVDENLAWALGFWFAEGSTADNGAVRVTNNDLSAVSRWVDIMSDKFCINGTTTSPKGRNWHNGEMYNKNLMDFFNATFGKGGHDKKLDATLMGMNEKLFERFFEGLYLGDGCKTTKHKLLELANPVLISQLSLLLNKYGIKHNLQLRKERGGKYKGRGYNGIITITEKTKTGTRSGIDFQDGNTYFTIEKLEKLEGRTATVYDIQVQEDESFSVGNVIVHNCFLSYIPDTRRGLVETRSEAEWLSMMGGGVGLYAGNRSPDEKSTGIMAHLRGYDADTLAYRQTATRRGSMAAYADITHPEIQSFIQMRNPVGGDSNKKCFNMNNGVNITDAFMEAVMNEEEYELIDPKHGATGRKLKATEIWEEILDTRFETGEPYLHFVDTTNRNIPKQIRNPLYRVVQSNLCSEITLMTSPKRTAVCCLSSLNLEKYEEWKDTTIVQDLIRYLDNVLEYFIRLAPPELKRAVYSACKERALGLGTLGWHSFLQSKLIPFESGGFNSAAQWTHKIYSMIKERAEEESKRLGAIRGESPDCRGSGFRNSHLIAIAPNASSADIVGASPSIEPWAANAFNSQGRAGSFLIKNKYLEKQLELYGLNTPEVWNSIIVHDGSCQHIEGLPQEIKDVFKTFEEINPMWVIELASIRQPYVCQSQSVNIKVPEDITKQEMSDIHFAAWKKGLKSLYYCRAKAATKANVGTGGEMPLNAVPIRTKIEYDTECLSCQG